MSATRRQLEQYYRHKNPTAQVTDFQQFTAGWENEVYAFTLTTVTEQRDLILRLYPGGQAARRKSSREFRGMKTLYEQGFPVPEVHILDTSATDFDQPFVIMARAAGDPLEDLFTQASAAETQQYASQFCTLFVRLHRLDWRPFSTHNTDDINRQMIEDYRSRSALIAPVLDWADNQPAALVCPTPSVVHQDYHPGNILYDNGRLTVIDWTNINVLDFRIDLAWTLMLVGSYASMAMRDGILALYQEAAGAPVDHIDVFEALACARRLHEFYDSLAGGTQAMGMREETVDIMRSQRPHYERVYARLQAITGLVMPEIERILESPGD